MLTPGRVLVKSSSSGKPLPHVPDLADLYSRGLDMRHGQPIMVAGRKTRKDVTTSAHSG